MDLVEVNLVKLVNLVKVNQPSRRFPVPQAPPSWLLCPGQLQLVVGIITKNLLGLNKLKMVLL